jgi:hypothetical protein
MQRIMSCDVTAAFFFFSPRTDLVDFFAVQIMTPGSKATFGVGSIFLRSAAQQRGPPRGREKALIKLTKLTKQKSLLL